MTDPTDPRIEAAVQANLELDQRVLFDRRALLIENTRLSDELVGLRAELQTARDEAEMLREREAAWDTPYMRETARKWQETFKANETELVQLRAEVTDLRQQLATVTESRDEYARRVRANWQARLAALNEAADAIKTDRERPSQTPPERSWASGNRLAESIVRGLAAERGAVLGRTETGQTGQTGKDDDQS